MSADRCVYSEEDAAMLWGALSAESRSGLLCLFAMYVRALASDRSVSPLCVPAYEASEIQRAAPDLVPLGLAQITAPPFPTPAYRLTRRGFDLVLRALDAGRDGLLE